MYITYITTRGNDGVLGNRFNNLFAVFQIAKLQIIDYKRKYGSIKGKRETIDCSRKTGLQNREGK